MNTDRKKNVTSVLECLDMEILDRYEGVQFIALRAFLDSLIISLIIGTNTFIVFAILRHRPRRKQETPTPSNVSVRLALNLAIADLLVGLTTVYYLSSKYLCSVIAVLSHLKYLCLSMFAMIMCAHATSAYTIVAIAIDRYIAVVHALRYRELMSTRNSRIMVGLVWIFSICVSSPVFYWNQWNTSSSCDESSVFPVEYLPVVTMLSHCIIMGIVGGFHRRIHHEAIASDERKRSRVYGVTPLPSRESRIGLKFHSKSAKVLLLVTGCYIICWTPITVIFFFRGYASVTPIIDVLYNYFFTFLNINYLLNPIVYSWMNPSVRASLLEVINLFSFKRKQSRGSVTKTIGDQNAFPSVSTVYSIT
ncbi:hypothetical protein C0J52_12850 [Blattella germanica]|nr:hypothetical protein C0J52_12850 [Blattella germanica]